MSNAKPTTTIISSNMVKVKMDLGLSNVLLVGTDLKANLLANSLRVVPSRLRRAMEELARVRTAVTILLTPRLNLNIKVDKLGNLATHNTSMELMVTHTIPAHIMQLT